ncbi:bifunctional pyr operon transcriptional regulator/uracil phosphoribosyltransferase, partial [Arthrospira platensis SPKY1]|nr:bifunctional pyr operon transcriptional regulator/uracil phosphoribosyltransferase [Arthrospira platensis SPKY1]
MLSAPEIHLILHRLVCQLIEKHQDFSSTVLVGLQPRGTFLAQRIHKMLTQEYQIPNIPLGQLDITFFRDDFRRNEKP